MCHFMKKFLKLNDLLKPIETNVGCSFGSYAASEASTLEGC